MDIQEQLLDILNTNVEFDTQIDLNNMDEKLAELGMNSLTYVKVIVSIEDTMGIEFDDDKIVEYDEWTFNSLKQYIIENLE